MQFFRAEVEDRIIAVAQLNERGEAYRLTRNRPTWERVPDLDRLAQATPADTLYWDAVDEETARSAAAELGAPSWLASREPNGATTE